MSYRVKLTDFEGPLDLLLHLIKKSEVAKNNRLFGPCAIEVSMEAQMRIEATVLTPEELAQSIKSRGCY